MSTFLSRQEVADYLQVSPPTITNWSKRKILNPIRIGGKLYFKKDEVYSLLPMEGAKK